MFDENAVQVRHLSDTLKSNHWSSRGKDSSGLLPQARMKEESSCDPELSEARSPEATAASGGFRLRFF